MNKREYMEKLLSLCSDGQKDLFSRMYPEGVDIKQLTWATTQIENTLKNLNEQKIEMQHMKKAHKEAMENANDVQLATERLLNQAARELEDAKSEINRLKNPISLENSKIQERLDLLDALEVYGVDNWDGYDFAKESMRGSKQ